MRARARGACVLLAALAFSFHAEAAPSEEAKKHFDAGKKLRGDGDCTNAIPEFEQSLAAEKSIGAYYNLGYCEAQLGRRQEAYGAYRRARDMASAKKDERLAEISGLIATLMETTHVRLLLPQPLPPGFRLQVDGEVVPEALYEEETIFFTKASPTHEIRASAPGYDDLAVSIESKQLKRIDLTKAHETVTIAPAPPPSSEPPLYRRRAFGIGLGAIGLSALTAGVVLLVKYNADLGSYESRANDALRTCGDGAAITSDQCLRQQPSPKRQDFLDRANAYNRRDAQGRDAGPLMVGLMAGGAILLGGGIYVLATAKAAEENAAKTAGPTFAPVLGPSVGGGSMTLRF